MDECQPLARGGCFYTPLPDAAEAKADVERAVRRCRLTPSHPRYNLKAPGTKRLKLKYDEPLSNLAFKFNLRRHSQVGMMMNTNKSRAGRGGISTSAAGAYTRPLLSST